MEKFLMEKITEITVAIQDIAPEVWEIMLKQIKVEYYQNVFGIIVSSIIFILSIIIVGIGFKQHVRHDNYDVYIPCYMFGGIGAVSTAIVIVICICTLIGLNINPEYYAIKLLLQK